MAAEKGGNGWDMKRVTTLTTALRTSTAGTARFNGETPLDRTIAFEPNNSAPTANEPRQLTFVTQRIVQRTPLGLQRTNMSYGREIRRYRIDLNPSCKPA